MDNDCPITEYELQLRLCKRNRIREIKTSLVLAVMLVFVSVLASYAVYFLSALLIGLFPALDTPAGYGILDICIYTAQLGIPIVMSLVFVVREPKSIYFVRESFAEPYDTERTTLRNILTYFVLAFSLSQIIATLSVVFTDIISYLASFLSENLILDPEAFSEPVPMSAEEFIISIFAVAVLPAILEELLFRGVFLGMFLQFGKTFAIVTSAFFFASVHGSIDQMMYSFVYGIIFGYIAVKTGSLTAGIIIHFMNNLYSCIIDYLGYLYDTDLFWNIVMIINITLMTAGLIIAIYRIAKNKIGYIEKHDSEKTPYELTGKETFSVFTCPLMLAYYAYIIFETLYTYISYNLTL